MVRLRRICTRTAPACTGTSGKKTLSGWRRVPRAGPGKADLDLVFCDEGYTFDVQLRAGATEAELTDLVNAAA